MYYNPLISDQESYYDPTQNSSGDAGQVLSEAAKNLVIIGALNIAGGLATKYIGGKVSNTLKQWSKNSKSIIRKNIANKITSTATSISNSISPITKVIKNSSIAKAGQARATMLKNIEGQPGHGLTRLTSAFKNPKTFLATTAGVWKQNVLNGMGVAYAVDSMLGITTRDLGLQKKKWHDVPGQITNFGKWLVNDSIYGTAMGAAVPTIKAIGSAGLQAARKTFGGSFGKQILNVASKFAPGIPHNRQYDKYFDKQVIGNLRSQEERKFASKSVSQGLYGLVGRISDSYRQINSALRTTPDSIKEAWKAPGLNFGVRTKKALGTISAAIDNVREINTRHRREVTSTIKTPGLRMFEFLDQLGKSKGPSGTTLVTKGLNDIILPEIKKLSTKGEGLSRVFSFLKPITVKDVVHRDKIKEVLGNLSARYVKSEADMVMNHVLNMKVGNNIYRDWRGSNIKGAGVDLGAFDPIQMMRRSASWIANKKFSIPMSKMEFSLGEITGASKFLAEKPSLEFFDNKPNFAFGDKNISSVGELGGSEAKWLYVNGKWAVFDGATVNVVNAHRKLYYSHKSSKDKSYELKTLNINRWKEKAENAAIDFNIIRERVDHTETINNPFLHFLDRRNIGLPSKLRDYLGLINDKLEGGESYKKAISSFFDGPAIESMRNLPLIDNVYSHTSQVFSRILQNKKALGEISQYLHDAKLKKDFSAVAFDDRVLIEKLDDAFGSIDNRFQNNRTMVRAYKDIKAYPKQATTHEVVKRLGSFSEMTSIDIARKNYIEDIFNKDFLADAPKGMPHPLLSSIPSLLEKGIINQKEAAALKLHAKLSVFRDEGLVRNIRHSSEFHTIREKVVRRAKENDWQVTNELIDFISNNKIRKPSIEYSRTRILKDIDPNPLVSDYITDLNPYVSVSDSAFGIIKDVTTKTMNSVTDMLSDWLPVKKRYIQHHGFMGNAKYLGTLIGGTAAAFGAYRITDSVIATNPIFDETALDEGLTGAGADILARTRMGLSRISDFTGYTATMKYLHGLAPTSESSIPGAIAGGIVGWASSKGPLGVIKGVLGGALINRIASPYLPDMTKSHGELVEIYSGRKEVPVMKAPTWLLGITPWEGSKVEAWSPNWYVRAKSRWKETDTLYGSTFRRLIHEPLPLLGFNVGDFVDPYYMERKHFFTRPYPVTGGVFDEVPIVGKILSSTIGRIIKPEKTMHQEFLQSDQISRDEPGNPYPFAVRPPTLGEGLFMMSGPSRNKTLGGTTTNGGLVTGGTKAWAETASEDFLYDIQNFAGLKGFLGGVVSERIFDTNKVVPTLESAGRIASFSRSYTDMNLGGMGMITEPLRRLIDKPLYKQYGINPIPNMMPNWLPAQFLEGDPYSALLRGELRLPGEAYLRTHTDVVRSMPACASMIGGTKEHIVQYFTGLLPPLLKEEYDILETGTGIHESIQQTLAAEGLLIQAEGLVNDVKNDITGHVDAIIRDGLGGRGRKALEIKTINDKAFQKLEGPKDQHIGQLNFYLKELKMQKGQILYVNRENPSQIKLFDLNFSQSRWERDIQKLKEARGVASTMMQEGVGDTLGYSYSWLDRLDILADVAPTSKEFKEAKYIVQKQIKAGILTNDELLKYEETLQKRGARIRKYELYPNRFKGKLFNPSTENDIQSINEDIKAAAEYSLPERAIGWIWEKFTNSNNIISNKFFAIKDPLTHYKTTRLYGKEYKPWDEPLRSWAEPMSRNLFSKTNPLEGAISYGFGGNLLGGPFGAILGAGAGAAYGTIHGLYRFATNSTYIPESIQDKRDIMSFFDAAKYERNNMMAQLSSGLTRQEFLDARNATLTAFNNNEGSTVANLFRGTSFMEKPYIESFVQEKDPSKRKEIIKFVPNDLGKALKKQWNSTDSKNNTQEYIQNNSQEISSNVRTPIFNQSVLDPGVNLEDIKLKVIENQGMDAHEFGLGWNEQMLRIQESQNNIQARTVEDLQYSGAPVGPNLSSAHVRGLINNLFNRSGIKSSTQVYINNSGANVNNITLVIRRDRSRTILDAINRRNKYKV